jgi:hypothetical protein
MGEIFTMKHSISLLTAMVLSLTACSGGTTMNKLAKVPGLENLAQETVALDPNVFALIDQVAAKDRKIINVIRIDRNAALDLLEVARQGNRSTYMSASRRSLTLKNGIVIQTQGIGGDLSTSQHQTYDLGDTGRVYTKTHGYLGGDNEIHTVAFRCIRTARPTDHFGLRDKRRLLTPVDEVCSNDTQSHENIYFLDPKTGKVFRSRQWVSDQIGYLRIEQIKLPSP